jgi:Icc-related predicted phosphoesterase
VRLHVVSDVHGAADSLPAAAQGSDLFICLGDLVLFVDYEDMSQGIFPQLFGADQCARFVELRTQGRYAQAREYGNSLWAQHGADRRAVLDQAVRAQYAELFAAMPEPALLTYGNVDLPAMWPEFLRPGHQVLDGEAVELDGVRFGFVGGGLVSPMRTPFELTDEEFARKVEALGEVDVLCSHIPPAVPELTYDTVARRFERGSTALLEAIVRTQPSVVLFGHVHQPLVSRMRIGRTECMNVGHFRGRRAPFVLDV